MASIDSKAEEFAAPHPDTTSLSPLPGFLRSGLMAVSTFAMLSFVTSMALMVHLIRNIIRWQLRRRRARQKSTNHTIKMEPPNQFLVLVINLLLSDVMQSTAFLLNIRWLHRDAIEVGTATCAAQGWFVSSGDLASSMFVMAIAIHSYLSLVRDYRLPTKTFYAAIAILWTFVYAISAAGWAVSAARHGELYTRAGAWCWVNGEYQDVRLFLHYLWLFIAMALMSILYAIIFIHIQTQYWASPDNADEVSLSRSASAAAHCTTESLDAKSPATTHGGDSTPPLETRAPSGRSEIRGPQRNHQHAFLLYPLVYVVCTAPLVAGRIATMAGRDVSLQYLCFAGAMISCNGWLDVLLYSTTRHTIIFGSDVTASDTGINTFAFMGTAGPHLGNTTVIESALNGRRRMGKKGKGGWRFLALTSKLGGAGAGRDDDERPVGGGGNDVALKGLGQIQAETTTMVVHEEGEHEPPQKFRNKGNTSGSATSRPASVRSMV